MTVTPRPMRCTNSQRLSVPQLKVIWHTSRLHVHSSNQARNLTPAPIDEFVLRLISQPLVPATLGPHIIAVPLHNL